SHGPRGRHLRPRGGLHRSPADSAAARPAGTQDRGGAHDHARGRALRARRRPLHRRHDHRAPPAVQPQRDFHRRHPAALLLPAAQHRHDHAEARVLATAGESAVRRDRTQAPARWRDDDLEGGSMNGKPRVALLIDADNSPAAKIGLILNELSTFGETNVRRAYGNWKKNELKGWEEQLHEHAIRPMQQFDYTKGKNASDMAMVIDALDLLYTDSPDAFGIVSSDADFTPLVMHLRAKGAAVYGFGARKTPEPFVNACSRFLFLDELQEEDADSEAGESDRSQPL